MAAEQRAERTFLRLKPYIDAYLPWDPFATLVVITAVLLVGTLLKDVFLIANNMLVARLAQLATFDLRKLFYRRTLRMDLATFNDEGTSDLMSRFTHDTEAVAGGLETLFGKLVREPLKMIACLVGAAWICWRLLLFSLVIAPMAGLVIRWLGKMLKRANRRGHGANGPALQRPGRDLPRHQDRQGIHQRAAGAQAVPSAEQGVLPEGDEDRPLRFPLAPHHRDAWES